MDERKLLDKHLAQQFKSISQSNQKLIKIASSKGTFWGISSIKTLIINSRDIDLRHYLNLTRTNLSLKKSNLVDTQYQVQSFCDLKKCNSKNHEIQRLQRNKLLIKFYLMLPKSRVECKCSTYALKPKKWYNSDQERFTCLGNLALIKAKTMKHGNYKRQFK